MRKEDMPICNCGETMLPIWFIEEEYKVNSITGGMYRTGRKRRNVSHFECPQCFNKECVDDSFAEPYR